MQRKQPLYRKVNTRTHSVRHGRGGDWSWDRNGKAVRDDDRQTGPMVSHLRHGLDYAPLARFLLSRIGMNWTETRREAVARLDREEPIGWFVATGDLSRRRYVRIGENSYFSGLYVDGDDILRKVDPTMDAASFLPSCACCTHTFNGIVVTRAYDPDATVGQD